jgi:hypothetical protein
MPYPNKDDYITFLFNLIDKFQESQTQTKQPGHPFDYDTRSLICFFAIMILKRCFAFKAMNRWLKLNTNEAQKLGFSDIPSRWTLSRRFKALYEVIKQFVAFTGQWASPLGEEFQTEAIYEDKSLFKARGPVWHKKDMQNNHIPENLRNLDTDATWGKSAYHGWVYGYGLHKTCTSSGFPILLEVDTASVSEHEVIKLKDEAIFGMNTGYIITDDGYTDFDKIRAYAQKGILLVTPAIRVKKAIVETYRQFSRECISWLCLKNRKAIIEPMFDLISRLLDTTDNHKQLPLKGKRNVKSFLAYGVMLTQLALLMNSIYGLPFHNISHLLTVFL